MFALIQSYYQVTNDKTQKGKISVYINIYINPRFSTYTLHRWQGHFFVVHFRIFFLNSLNDFEHFKFLGSKFKTWALKEAIASVSLRTVFTFIRSKSASLRKLNHFLISNTSFEISGAILL